MIKAFGPLSSQEEQYLLEVPVLISVLIAGSENELNESELEEASFYARLKKSRAREDLKEYYHKVGENFDENLQVLLGRLSSDRHERNKELRHELSKLNRILPKLDQKIAINLYASYKAFARHVAQAGDGLLGYMAVTPEENELLELSMIQKPIIERDEEI
jgi:hypothetical protein